MKYTFVALLIVSLVACSHSSIDDYATMKPALHVEQFFNGNLIAHGLVKNRSGEVIRTFSANIHASWQDGVGTLDEDFVFDDGELQKRIWTLTPNSNNGYIATANDVVGKHAMAVKGNALFMEYVLTLPYNESTLDVTVDDKMFLVTDNRILNESVFYKWGFKVASVQLVIEKGVEN